MLGAPFLFEGSCVEVEIDGVIVCHKGAHLEQSSVTVAMLTMRTKLPFAAAGPMAAFKINAVYLTGWRVG